MINIEYQIVKKRVREIPVGTFFYGKYKSFGSVLEGIFLCTKSLSEINPTIVHLVKYISGDYYTKSSEWQTHFEFGETDIIFDEYIEVSGTFYLNNTQ